MDRKSSNDNLSIARGLVESRITRRFSHHIDNDSRILIGSLVRESSRSTEK